MYSLVSCSTLFFSFLHHLRLVLRCNAFLRQLLRGDEEHLGLVQLPLVQTRLRQSRGGEVVAGVEARSQIFSTKIYGYPVAT
jgi:hypothetical protein